MRIFGYEIRILRPISDINKQIEHNGEKFIPSEELKVMGTFKPYKDDSCYVLRKLIEWNFDVYNK